MPRLGHHNPTAAPGSHEATGGAASTYDRVTADGQRAGDESFPAPPLTLSVDWKLFEHHLADADLTEEERREFIEALWYIIVSFVDLGFGIEPVQHALKAAIDDPKPAVPVLETAKESRCCSRQDDARNGEADHREKESNQKGRQE